MTHAKKPRTKETITEPDYDRTCMTRGEWRVIRAWKGIKNPREFVKAADMVLALALTWAGPPSEDDNPSMHKAIVNYRKERGEVTQ